jgi:hypothetical protein
VAGVVGRSSRKSDKLWRDALMVAVRREDDQDPDKRQLLTTIAEACVNAARAGDLMAMKEIGDRIDGKPKQQTELTGADGEALAGIDVRIVSAPS